MVMLFLSATSVHAQLTPKKYNLTTFPSNSRTISNEMEAMTTSHSKHHPEYGYLPMDAPCEDCFELIDARTENTRTYIVNESGGSHTWVQTANGPIHSMNTGGDWITIDGRLSTSTDGVYKSSHQTVPTELNTVENNTKFFVGGYNIIFNHVRMLYENEDGVITDFGEANWSMRTVGENGAYIKDAWENVDIEIVFDKGHIKTNYIIQEALPYVGGKIIFRDTIAYPSSTFTTSFDEGEESDNGYIGKFIVESNDGFYTVEWDKALITDNILFSTKADMDGHFTFGEYVFSNNSLDLVIDNDWLHDIDRVYPVVVDPLVSVTTSSAVVYKFNYLGEFCGGAEYCSNIINAVLPAHSTVTNATCTLLYKTKAGTCVDPCWMSEAAFRVWSDSCDIFSPPGSLFWSCNVNAIGTCSGVGLNIFEIVSCLTPKCSGTIPIEFRTSYCYCSNNGFCPTGSAVPCHTVASGNASIYLEGKSVETLGGASEATVDDSFCCENFLLDPAPTFGVPPYTYVWDGFGGGGSTASDTTVYSCGDGLYTYTCSVTDACGVTNTATFNLISDDCGVLAVNLTDWDGEWTGENVRLYWDVESQINNDFFTIQRSSNARDFKTIVNVSGEGTTSTPRSYVYKDEKPTLGTNYYRLLQNDFDGTIDTLGIIAVIVPKPFNAVLYPNPAKDVVTIEISPQPDMWIELQNMLGNSLSMTEVVEYRTIIETKHLDPGLYIVKIMTPQGRELLKLIKQ